MGIYQITVTKFKPLSPSDASRQGYVVANNPTEAIDLYNQIHGKIQPLDRFSMCQLAADFVDVFVDVAAAPKPATAPNTAQAEALRRIAEYIEVTKNKNINILLQNDLSLF